MALASLLVACDDDEANDDIRLDDPPELTMIIVGKYGCDMWADTNIDGVYDTVYHTQRRMKFYNVFRNDYYSNDSVDIVHSKYRVEFNWMNDYSLVVDSVVFNSDSSTAVASFDCFKGKSDKVVMQGNASFEEFSREAVLHPVKATFVVNKGVEKPITIRSQMSCPETFSHCEVNIR